MLKFIIFFIFSLILVKISWPDILDASQSSVAAADNHKKHGYFDKFPGLLRVLQLLYALVRKFRKSLLAETHSRKFYRFFAFEFFFLLILVNYGYWLRNPFTIFRLITWIILGSSFLLAGLGIYHLLECGKPLISGNIEITTGPATSGIYKYIRHPFYGLRIFSDIETTTELVESGIYKYIRHPLYSALILLGAVTLIKNPSLLATSLFSVAVVFLYATARVEEKENLLKFGEDYAVYMRRSRMFFPFSVLK